MNENERYDRRNHRSQNAQQPPYDQSNGNYYENQYRGGQPIYDATGGRHQQSSPGFAGPQQPYQGQMSPRESGPYQGGYDESRFQMSGGNNQQYRPNPQYQQGYGNPQSFQGQQQGQKWNSGNRPYQPQGDYYGAAEYRTATGQYSDMNRSEYRNQQGPSQWAQTGGSRGGTFDERGYGGSYGSRNFSGKGPKGYRRSSDRIREEVCDLLTDHSQLDASQIEVSVDDGVVKLSGDIDSRHSKRLAENCCDQVRGVRDVRNELSIKDDFWGSSSSSGSTSKSKSKSKSKSNDVN